jgi:hypothetical protein
MLYHVGQQLGGEYLCHRADFEDRIAVELSLVILVELPIGDNSAAVGIDHPDYDPNALPILIDALRQNLANF